MKASLNKSSQKPLHKAVFPVAGMGTRFLPATKSIPKEMLTVVDRPLIQYAVDEAVEAGIDILIFVTGRSKQAIVDYFDRNPELEAQLEAKQKQHELDIVRNVIPPHVKCFFVRQHAPLGLGHAVSCAADLINDEPFAVLLPDDLIDGAPKGVLSQMADLHRKTQKPVLAVENVPLSEVHKYGIIKPKDSDQYPLEVEGIVEKPNADEAPSTWSVVGRYILPPEIMQVLQNQTPGAGGEIQLTDAIATCIPEAGFLGYPFHGKRFDCGNKHGFLEANIHFGLRKELRK
jgi:UTP--glucose-1-phosphate uridylyltransferase